MKKAKSGLKGLIIFLICVIEVYPLFWMLTASLKQQSEWSEYPAYALNKGFYFQNYIDAWTRGNMATFFKNSLITTVVSLIFIVIFATTIGSALIPLFQIYSKTNRLNTRTCLILTYIAFGLSLSIYLVQGYLRSFPDDIMEAAVIDGCGIYRMMWHIVVPLMKNAIVTVLVLQFFFKWNDLLFSMTFISDSSLKTVQTGLLYFSDEFGGKNWGAIFASVSLSVFPMLILYTALNKKVMEGMTAGAVKGQDYGKRKNAAVCR